MQGGAADGTGEAMPGVVESESRGAVRLRLGDNLGNSKKADGAKGRQR
jgi:hypothetical protein